MMATTYFKITLKNVRYDLETSLTKHCFDCGALGVSESLSFVQPNLVYEPKILHSKMIAVDAYFNDRPASEFFDGIKTLAPNVAWDVTEEASKDWLEEWKKGFKAFKLIDKYWVIPSWEKVPSECQVPIFIDPGMAFGTGTHATTQMAAYLTVKSAKQKTLSNSSLLDVGTGTGILGILGRHVGFSKVKGLEDDPEAIRVAGENVVKNKISAFEVSATPIDELRESFDLVVANIIDGVLLKIKPYLVKCMKPNGSMILTGILKDHESEFISDFIEEQNLRIELRLEKDDWVGFWVTHA